MVSRWDLKMWRGMRAKPLTDPEEKGMKKQMFMILTIFALLLAVLPVMGQEELRTELKNLRYVPFDNTGWIPGMIADN